MSDTTNRGANGLKSKNANAREIAAISWAVTEYCRAVEGGFCEWTGPAASFVSDDPAVGMIFDKLKAQYPHMYTDEVLKSRESIMRVRLQSVRLDLCGRLRAAGYASRKPIVNANAVEELKARVEKLEQAISAMRNISSICSALEKQGL